LHRAGGVADRAELAKLFSVEQIVAVLK